jgi:hypothetical protein
MLTSLPRQSAVSYAFLLRTFRSFLYVETGGCLSNLIHNNLKLLFWVVPVDAVAAILLSLSSFPLVCLFYLMSSKTKCDKQYGVRWAS